MNFLTGFAQRKKLFGQSASIMAEKLGITKEALVACLQALSMWGDVNFYDLDEVAQTIREIGLAADTVDGTAVNARNIVQI